ncbi:DDT domain superfamily isoform X2 [Carex rostrata]
MAMGRGTWVTVLCRKLRDWWHWVGEGEVPIVADHGAEIEAYKILDPATRLVVLKAICDIRVEQEDIRNYIDHSLKRGAHLSLFRKERVGGDSYGISYWYEDDPMLGHRLYREIRKVETPTVEAKKPDTKKRKGRPPPPPPPIVTYQWETVATNLDEFQEVSDKLFASKNRTEVSLAKKLKIDFLPEIEKTHKMNIALMQKKEKLLKKQQREALLLNSYLTADGVTSGRSLRHRKSVTYTFDDYDRSINEAIKLTKRSQESPEPAVGSSTRRVMPRHEASANGKSNGPSSPPDDFHDPASPKSEDNYAETDHEGDPDESLDRSNRRRKRPRRYSEDFVDAVSYDVDATFESDDDIVGEAVYDDEYLKTRKSKSASSGSEGDEEYKLDDEEDDENPEEDESGDEEEDYSIGSSEEELEMSRRSRRHKKESARSKRGGRKLRSVGEIDTGLRRSKRSTRPKINYRKYEVSESDTDSDADADGAYSENDQEVSTSSQDRNEEAGEEMEEDVDYDNNYNNGGEHSNYDSNGGNEVTNKEYTEMVAQEEQKQESLDKERSPNEEKDSLPRRFLDLNDPAPDMGFDDGPDMPVKDEDMDDS